MYQNVLQVQYIPIESYRFGTVENVREDVSVLENEDEELPRPETVTVSALPDELGDDTDSFPCQDSDPLSIDPLFVATRAEPVSITIKEEPVDDSEVFGKVEPFGLQASCSDASNEIAQEDDGYRSASDEGAASRGQPGRSHLNKLQTNENAKLVACEKEQFSERQNTAVEVGIRAEVNPGTDVRQSPCDRVSKERSIIETNTSRSKVATRRESAVSDGSENPLTGTNRKGSERQSKEWAKIQMCAALRWSKGNSTRSTPEDNLLSNRGLHESVRVVLTRCMEAEELVSSMRTTGQIVDSELDFTNSDEIGTLKRNNALIIPSAHVAKKIPRLKLRKVGKTSGWEMAPVTDEHCVGEIKSAEERRETSIEYRSSLENMQISSHTNILRTGSKRIIQNGLTLGNKSSRKTSVRKKYTSTGKEEQAIVGVRDELVVSNVDGEELNSAEGKACNQGAELQSWTCIGCHRAFKSAVALSGHLSHCTQREGHKVKILDNPYTCKLCGKTFSSKFRLLSHSAMHRGSMRCRCSTCGKYFESFSHLKEHSRMHKTENSCDCEVCGLTFVSVRALRVHKTKVGHASGTFMSTLLKPMTKKKLNVTANAFPCEVCNLTFSTSAGLTRHRIVHSEQLIDAEGLKTLNIIPTQQSSHGQLHEPQLHSFSKTCNRDMQHAQKYSNVVTETSLRFSQKGRKVFCCGVCGKKFSSSLKLKIHVCLLRKQIHQPLKKGMSNPTKNRWSCYECGKTLSSNYHLKEHLNGHRQFKPYQCPLCTRKFSNNYRLKVHFNVHTGERPYRCDMCEMAFHSPDSLRTHNARTHGQNPKCNHCGKFFNSQIHLKTHKCFSSKPTLVSDDVHQNVSSTGDPLKKHVLDDDFSQGSKTNSTKTAQLHEGKFTCEVCEKTTTTSAGMIVHMHTHLGKPPHCDICDKTFSTSTRLKEHICSKHTFERPYHCNLCEKTYPGPDGLRHHKLKYHKLKHRKEGKSALKCNSSGKSYKCNYCDLTFPTYLSLKTHKCFLGVKRNSKLQTHSGLLTNGKTHKCDLCSGTFTSRGYLVRHKNRFHSGKKNKVSGGMYKCEHCDATFNRPRSLMKHNQQFHPGRPRSKGNLFECNKCSVLFKTREYLLNHYSNFHQDGEKESFKELHKCELCNASFNLPGSLLRHNRHYHAGKSHSKGKSFECSKCSASFNTDSHLTRHFIRFHQGKEKKSCEALYNCKQCNATFSLPGTLLRHNRRFHTEKTDSKGKCFECNECSACYYSHNSLIRHYSSCHQGKEKELPKEVYEYKQCNESTLVRHNQLSHTRKHSVCNLCGAVFTSHHHLMTHKCQFQEGKSTELSRKLTSALKSHSSGKKYKCKYCKKTLPTSQHLAAHVRVYHKNKKATSTLNSYECANCNVTFSQRSLLLKHNRNFHNRQLKSNRLYYKCNLCSAKYICQSNLVKHKSVCHKEKDSFQCNICLKEFSSGPELISHCCDHFKKPCHSCVLCGNSYDVLEDLKEHMLKHTTLMSSDNCIENRSRNDTESIEDKHMIQLPVRKRKRGKKNFGLRKYRCDQCKKNFLTMGSLKRHKMIHANQWPYPCKMCGQAFRERCKLALHMRKHSTSGLGETSNVSSTLLRHNKHLHTGKHSVCNLCGVVFTSHHHLVRHTCQFREGKSTELSHKLTSALKSHSSGKKYKCKYCKMTFPASQRLAVHVRFHHKSEKAMSTLNSYKCANCDLTFNQKSLLLKHNRNFHIRQSKSNRTYYKCNLCSAKYFCQSNLVRHKSVCHEQKDSFQCNTCLIAFSSEPELISHYCEHFKEPCHSCALCGNSYDVLEDLKEHMLMHTTLMS